MLNVEQVSVNILTVDVPAGIHESFSNFLFSNAPTGYENTREREGLRIDREYLARLIAKAEERREGFIQRFLVEVRDTPTTVEPDQYLFNPTVL